MTPAVLKRSKDILDKYDLETVQIASAGAATFYQWVSLSYGIITDAYIVNSFTPEFMKWTLPPLTGHIHCCV